MTDNDYDPRIANRKTTIGRLRYLSHTASITSPEARAMLNSAANTTEELIKQVERLINLIENRGIFKAYDEPADFTAVSDTKSALVDIKHFVKEDTQ